MLTDKDVLKSFERVKDNTSFFDAFYALFAAADSRVAEKFRNTEMSKQKAALVDSIYCLLKIGRGVKEAEDKIEQIAVTHDRHHKNIEPELYGVWLRCLTETLYRYDKEFNFVLEEKWRRELTNGIFKIISKY